MNDAKGKLISLLAYWLEHNKEHGAEFREWAERTEAEQPEVAAQLRQAADKMAETDECLENARKLMR